VNSAWVKSQDRKRNLLAAGSTACVYIIAFLGAWLVGMIAPTTLASVPGMILVDLGGSEGPPGAIPQGLENAPDRPTGAPPGAAPLAAPAPVSGSAASASSVAALPEAAPKSATAKVAASKTPTAKAQIAKSVSGKASSEAKSAAETAKEAADAQAAAVADAAAQERVAQEESALRAAAATAAASGPPKTKTFGSSSSGRGGGAPVTSSGSGSSPGVAGGTGSVTFRGSEMGNSLSTTFGASSGSAGRNIYVPIYLYMPLPSRIDAATYRNIQTKETFRSYYQQSGADWTLKSQVPLSQRGEFWTMLEAAGYDASTADFKAGRELQPVTLEFAVGPQSKNRVELVDLRLITSSGSSEVDEAVIYGFRQASFFNKTGNAVGGKFVYGF
jgi:hypothetical protein